MEHEQLRQAYLDGELTACEAAEFEATLSDADRAGLLAEQRLHRGIADALACEVPCPDGLWEQTQAALRRQTGPRPVWRRVGTAASVLAAAAIALMVSMWLFNVNEESSIVMAARSVDELRAESEIPAGPDEAEAYLAAHGIHLTFEPQRRPKLIQVFHRLDFVGAKTNHVWDEDVVTLLVVCCNSPVKVVFAKKKSEAAKALGEAAATSEEVQVLQPFDGYVVAVVSHHGAPYIMDVFVRE